MLIAQIIVYSVAAYLLIGVVFAAYFVVVKIGEIDEAAKATGIGFKALIFFGAVPFWMFLFLRLKSGSKPVVEKNAHRGANGGSND